MKRFFLLALMLCLMLPRLPLELVPPANDYAEPTAFVVEAGRYAWAWADARYYTCLASPAKELL